MKEFAALLDRLSYTPARNAKLRLLTDYFRRAPDPARGYALAAITGTLTIDAIKSASVRALAESRVDPALFGWSYDYVGDLAETVALIWPAKPGANRPPALDEVVETLRASSRREAPQLLRTLARCAGSHRPLGAAEADHRSTAGRRVGAAGQDGAGGVRGCEIG